MNAARPPDEEARLADLHGYGVLDTEPEQAFDDLALLASQICGAPVAMISLVDDHRQWFKSKIGVSETETARDIAFCAHGILGSELFVVPDALADPRFADNPLVTGQRGVRFYAGAPLINAQGHALGMVCVNDKIPRILSEGQKAALRALGRQVVAQLELHRTVNQLRQAEEQLRGKTAFLEAQVNSSLAGILVVDDHARKILQNQRFTDLLGIPAEIAADPDDFRQRRWVSNLVKDSGAFLEKIRFLHAHPDQISHDEIEFKDGRIMDRYSSPVIGHDGTRYGRIWALRNITDRKKAEESLRLLGSAVQQSKESILITEAQLDFPGPRIVFVNPAFTAMTGYTAEDILGKTPRVLQGPRTDKKTLARLRKNLAEGQVFAGEAVNYKKDGSEFILDWQIAPIRDGGGKITHYVAIQRDVTEQKRFEAQMSQSQRMETVGKLAGGIAHEFNSILTAIIGQSELALGELPPESRVAKGIFEIRAAADRAAALTQQLLAYGRKQILQPQVLDLNAALTSMEGTFRHVVGREVDVRMMFEPHLKSVKIDPGQLEQVIINVVMNAAEAMPNGGKLTVETSNTVLTPEYAAQVPDLQPGPYVMLAISDTGPGLTPEVKKHLFEPFFTTKPIGQGTGLGLATCYGILKQSGGHINVYSESGRGATFKIYLPEFAPLPRPAAPAEPPPLPRGTETILLVEDDPSLREMAATVLTRLGYTVLAASHGVEALTVRRQYGARHVDLVFTDIVMPHMAGQELAERIRLLYPQTKILFTSAFAQGAFEHQGQLDPSISLLQKPFTPFTLAAKIRATLDQN